MPSPTTPPPLLALSPGGTSSPAEARELVRCVGAAVEAGLQGLLLREPLLPDGPYLALARLCRAEVPWLALHDRPHLVAAAGADAVHVGFRSLTPVEARAVAGAATAIGFSGHIGDAPELLATADYSTFGPVYPTASKRDLVPATGLDALAERCARAGHPVLALGGVTPERAPACLARGAAGVAVLGGLLGPAGASPEPAVVAARVRAFHAALADAGRGAPGEPGAPR